MTQTGGLTAEMVRNDTGPVGLGYGLCWRKELNWQFMCWEYMQPKLPGNGNVDSDGDPEPEEERKNKNTETTILNDDYANVNSFASSTHV